MDGNQQQMGESGQGIAEDLANPASAAPSQVKLSSRPRRLLSFIIDMAVGVGALVVAGLLVAILPHASLQVLLPLTCAVFFAAAAIKANWSHFNPWGEGLAISLGAFFPVAVMAVAVGHAGRLEIWGFAILLIVACGAGAQAQKLWQAHRPLAGAAIAAALLAVVFAGGRLIAPWLASMEMRTINQPAPSFTVMKLDGTPVTLDSTKGRVVVLDFWGTWCEPCMAEMPTILKVNRRFVSDPRVEFLAVNALWQQDTPDLVRSFVQRRRLDVSVALDTQKAARTFKVESLPTLIFIDRKGIIRTEKVGYAVDEPLETELTREILGLLAEPGQ